ncbi:EamA-like transporter family protein [compost metagenome]
MVCYTIWSGTLLLLVYLPGLWTRVHAASAQVNIALLLLGIFPSALAYLAWAYVLAHSNVSRASMALYLVPPTAMLMASVLLAELPSPWVVVGAGIVLSSVLALGLQPSRRARASSKA